MFRVRVLLLLLFVYGASLLHAQGNSEAAHVRSLNNALLRLHGQLQAADSSQGASLHSQASAVIQERFNALQSLIKQDPTEALDLAFDQDLLAGLAESFPESASQLESRGEWQGPVEYVVFDDPTLTNHRVDIRMTVAQDTYDVHFPENEPGWLKCGDILHVQGVKAGTQVAAAGGNVAGQVAGAGCSTTGDQKIAAILINFPGITNPTTPAMVQSILFGTSGQSVNTFWREGSYGKASASGVVLGPYTLSQTYTCDQYDAMRAAAMAAADPDVNFTGYSRIMIVFPDPGSCGWAGLGLLGCTSYSTNDGAITASTSWLLATYMTSTSYGVRLATHEGGHNLTLHHASSRAFTNATTGLPEPLGPLNTTGTLSEYGSSSNTMGYWNFGQYDAPHKAMIGWLTSSDYTNVSSNGSFSIAPYENTAGLRALRVQRGTGNSAWLWLEYRQPISAYGYDNSLNSQIFTGADVHYEDSQTGTHTHLLDFTPSSAGGFSDPALFGSWTDPYTNLTLNVNSASGTALGVTVSYGAVPCVHSAPTISISPSNPSVPALGSANYTVTVTNNDTTGCAGDTFNLSSTLPASGWNTSFTSASLSINPGSNASTTMTKTDLTGATGTFAVNAIATAVVSGLSGTGNANATVFVAPTTNVTVGSPSYKLKTTVTMTATVKSGGNAAPGASVKFVMTKYNGSTTTKTVTANSSGVATWSYKLTPQDKAGSYSVTGQATYNGLAGPVSASVEFSVQ